jgi:outer membrane lipopolysaccharide assembly protein LptE/RlpB
MKFFAAGKRTSAAKAGFAGDPREARLKPCPTVRAAPRIVRAGPSCALLLCFLSGCGYHQVGAATHLPPDVRTLAVPIFQSKVQGFKTETVFTEAVVRELNTRTKYRVLTASGDGSFKGATADAVLRGTIESESVTPLTYDESSGQTASYLITITANVVLTAHDGRTSRRRI